MRVASLLHLAVKAATTAGGRKPFSVDALRVDLARQSSRRPL